jgi:hypothetical protein
LGRAGASSVLVVAAGRPRGVILRCRKGGNEASGKRK